MAGSAGRRKRALQPGAGEAAEDQQDCGVLLFSDRPDRCPVQPDETAAVLRKRSPRLRDLSRTPASESIFCCSLCYKAFISSSSLEAHHKASHKTFSFSSCSSSLETNHKASSSSSTSSLETNHKASSSSSSSTSSLEANHKASSSSSSTSSLETNHKASSSSSSSSSLETNHKASSSSSSWVGARPTQRPHPCAVCSRSFRRPCLLREHLKSHGPGRTGAPGHGSAQEPVSQPDASEPRDLSTKPSAGNHGDPAGRPEDEEDKAADRGEEDVGGLINSDGEEEHWKSPSRTAQKERDVAAAAAARAGPKPRHGCPVCGRDCLKASALQKHLRVHSGERPFQCPVCRKSFVQHVHMTEHRRIHTGERPYTCPLCGRSFTFSSALRRHQRLHADARPFQCAVCHKSFKQLSSLKGHQLVHTGVRFPCPVCSKSFSRPLELSYHVGTHSSARPYYCHACQKNLSGARVYRKHLKRHQGETGGGGGPRAGGGPRGGGEEEEAWGGGGEEGGGEEEVEEEEWGGGGEERGGGEEVEAWGGGGEERGGGGEVEEEEWGCRGEQEEEGGV
ncbi:zinc finger protein 154-like isoform X2 [Gadus macrocephalus]|uniref:zinc finger protein 154-like isoform X2 n=1 Tax=Gadus macrocephalus TaxID=80720 RepID=UPI0028CB5625|nr:zinc finger protein 154-like isoform X2 [Gadus macrocephalus]